MADFQWKFDLCSFKAIAIETAYVNIIVSMLLTKRHRPKLVVLFLWCHPHCPLSMTLSSLSSFYDVVLVVLFLWCCPHCLSYLSTLSASTTTLSTLSVLSSVGVVDVVLYLRRQRLLSASGIILSPHRWHSHLSASSSASLWKTFYTVIFTQSPLSSSGKTVSTVIFQSCLLHTVSVSADLCACVRPLIPSLLSLYIDFV